MLYFLITIFSAQLYCNQSTLKDGSYAHPRSPNLFIELCKIEDAEHILSDHDTLVKIMNRYSRNYSTDDGIDQARYIREISEKYRFNKKETTNLIERSTQIISYKHIGEIIRLVIPPALSYVQEMRHHMDYKLKSKLKIFENLKNQIGELAANKVEEFFPKSMSSFSCFIEDDDSFLMCDYHLYKIINFKGTLYLLRWKLENMVIHIPEDYLIKMIFKNELSDCVDLLNEGRLRMLPPSMMNNLEQNAEGKWQYKADKLY